MWKGKKEHKEEAFIAGAHILGKLVRKFFEASASHVPVHAARHVHEFGRQSLS